MKSFMVVREKFYVVPWNILPFQISRTTVKCFTVVREIVHGYFFHLVPWKVREIFHGFCAYCIVGFCDNMKTMKNFPYQREIFHAF
jgi:hypothetical protein